MSCFRRSVTFASVVVALLLSPYVGEAQYPSDGEGRLEPGQLVGLQPSEMLGSDFEPQPSSSRTGNSRPIMEAPSVCAGGDTFPSDLAGSALRRLACPDGFWVDGECPEGDICATWCSLKGTSTVCFFLGGSLICVAVCDYGDCGLS